MPVVSNTSPIWNLASIERLDLLHDQFPDVRIPNDVLAELQVGHEYPEMERIRQALDATWLTVESFTNLHLQQSLMLKIDRGEVAGVMEKGGHYAELYQTYFRHQSIQIQYIETACPSHKLLQGDTVKKICSDRHDLIIIGVFLKKLQSLLMNRLGNINQTV